MSQVITTRDFQKKGQYYYVNKVVGTGGMLVVKQDWCGHCKTLAPILEKVAKKLGKAYNILKLDGDDDSGIVESLGVQGFPTIFYIERDGKVSGKYTSGRDEFSILQGICDKSLVCRK
jgi:thioredoxin-like negative regulator of GroEL